MLLENKEYEGIVVDNVDTLGKFRLKVFIFGYHDLTGTLTEIENLPWAYSSQFIAFQFLPPIGAIVKVKFNFSYQQNLIWYPTSHYTKIGEKSTNPFPFLVRNPEKEKFIEAFKSTTNARKKRIQSDLEYFESEKTRVESEIQELKKAIEPYTTDQKIVSKLQLMDTFDEAIVDLEKELAYQEQQADLEYNRYQNNLRYNRSAGTILWDSEGSQEVEGGRIPSGESQVFPSLEQYIQYLDEPDEEDYNTKINFIEKRIDQINSAITTEIKNKQDFESIGQDTTKKGAEIQVEINKKVNELAEINKKINDLNSTSSSSALAQENYEELKNLPEGGQITRFDRETGKVYTTINGEEKLIGNWTGLYFFTPGFNGQPGIPIYDRPSTAFIKEESYLMTTNVLYAAQQGNTTANHPPQNAAIKASNADKAHSCDLSDEIRTRILTKRKDIMMAMKWLRDKIASFFSGAANSAVGQWIKATTKMLTALLLSVQKFLKFVNDVILETTLLVVRIRRLINWILSLPAQLLALLQECLTHF
jgi:hypothetical protein